MINLHISFSDGSNPYVRFGMDEKAFRRELARWKRNFSITAQRESGTFVFITLTAK